MAAGHAEMTGPWAAGPWVETTGAVLARLPREDWVVLQDIRWPGRRYPNVAQVVIGPPGVFVIDARAWTGRITVTGGVLRENGRMREMAVVGALEAAQELTGSVGVRYATPVLCFVRDEQLVGRSRGVLVCSTANLLTMLCSRPVVLTRVQRGMAALGLDASVGRC